MRIIIELLFILILLSGWLLIMSKLSGVSWKDTIKSWFNIK